VFDVNWTINNTQALPVIFLIIKGGLWESGFETARTLVGTKATNVDFEPCGLFTMSVKRVTAGTGFEDINHNLGAADALTNAAGAMTAENGASPTNVGDMSSVSKVVRYNNAVTQAVLAESDLDSFNPNNFILDWTTVDGNAYKFMWLASGNTIFPGEGTWIELGRTTLGAPSDDVIVTGLPNVEYYMVLADIIESANLQPVFRIGNAGSPDTGANYANRRSDNGAADITSGTANEIISNPVDAAAKYWFNMGVISNLIGHEKIMVGKSARSQTGDTTAPARSEFTGKYVPNAEPLDTIALRNLSSGDFQVGTELVVLGWSRFDSNLVGSNFWAQLTEVTASGGETFIDTPVFQPKKYMWISVFAESNGVAAFQIRVGSGGVIDTGTNYHIRRGAQEAADNTISLDFLPFSANTSSSPRITTNYYVINKAGVEKLFHGRQYEIVSQAGPNVGRSHETVKWDGQSNALINIVRLFRDSGAGTLLAGAKIQVWGHD